MVAPDGDYLLYKGGNLFTAYCYNMATKPREYIDLAKTGTGANFSQYTAGGASPGTNVRTSFMKLRINPGSLTVDIGDLTFASSTGLLHHSGGVPVTSMPYSVAMSCVAPNTAAGVGNINLQNTPFQVNSEFAVAVLAPPDPLQSARTTSWSTCVAAASPGHGMTALYEGHPVATVNSKDQLRS